MRYSLPLAVVALFSLPGLYAQGNKVVGPSDIANLKQVTDQQISPDGKHVLYVVNTPVAAGKHKDAHIWIASTGAVNQGRPFIYSAGTDVSPRWSPDGNWVAFLSDRASPMTEAPGGPFHFSVLDAKDRKDLYQLSEKKDQVNDEKSQEEKDKRSPEMQLWEISLHGGEAIPLTNIPGGIKIGFGESFKWSKDGKLIAFIRTDQDTKEEHDRKVEKNDEIVVDHDYKYDRLWIYDLALHQARLLTKSNINVDDFDWAPDGKQILARVSPTPRIDDYWRVSKIVILDSSTGREAKTLEEHAGYMRIRWSPDGRRVLFSKMTTLHITDLHLIYDLDSGKAIILDHAFPGTINEGAWSPDSKSVYLVGILDAHTVVLKADASSGVSALLKAITTADEYRPLTVSQDGDVVSFLGETPAHPDEVWEFVKGHAEQLTETNAQVKDWTLGSEKEIEWKSSKDGRTIYGVLLLPPGYRKGERYKTIVHIHGGPEEAWTVGWHGAWYNYGTMLASHGYVVLLPNPRGSDGQGPAFAEANYRDWGGGGFQDIMDGVDALIAEGVTDPNRMAVGGWSFGGFMTAWTVTHTDRFKAGMVGAGVTDLFSMATTTDIAPSFEDGYFGDLATNAKLYDAHSPVRNLSQCHTPVLVLHGEADQRVPISQGEEFYNGLRFLGRNATMVRYPREPHIFTEREHQIDSLQRILGWYDSHLEQPPH